MIYPSLGQLLIAAFCLIIPVAIMLGHRWLGGPIVVCSGTAFGIFAIFWLFAGSDPAANADILVCLAGVLLLLAALVLALSAATQARLWGWVALLTAAAYLSVVAIVYAISQPDPCIFGPNPELTPGYATGRVCTAIYPLVYWLVIAGYFVGPAATLTYGLRTDGLRRGVHARSEGLSISSLRATSDPSAEN